MWLCTHKFHARIDGEASYGLVGVNCSGEGFPEGKCTDEGKSPGVEDDDGIKRGVQLQSYFGTSVSLTGLVGVLLPSVPREKQTTWQPHA